jgi:DNA-binding NarL/FixJ family response regulator
VSEHLAVLLADDDPATRAGVRQALEAGGLLVCGEASDADEAISHADRGAADVYLLSTGLVGGGIAAAAEIRARRPDATIVMFADSANDAELFDALRAGASGYLPKGMDAARLPFAIKDAHHGHAAIPRQLVSRLVEEFRKRPNGHPRLPDRPNARLSRREWQALELVHAGMGTGEIAEQLSISAVTVRRHISSAVEKLDVPDRRAAARLLDRALRG